MCAFVVILQKQVHTFRIIQPAVLSSCVIDWHFFSPCFLLMKQHEPTFCWSLSGKQGSRSTAYRGACETLGDHNIRIHKHTQTRTKMFESPVYNTQLLRWKNTKKNPQIRRHSHHLSSNPVLASGGYLKQNQSRVLPLLVFMELSAVHFCILSNATRKYPD